MNQNKNNPSQVLYDGHCNFCVGVVDFLQKKDKQNTFEYLPLQKKEARALLKQKGIDFASLKTIYFVDGEKVHKRSKAIFSIFQKLPMPWRFLSGFRILPVFLTDAVYKLIAKYRYSLFGKREEIHEPTNRNA